MTANDAPIATPTHRLGKRAVWITWALLSVTLLSIAWVDAPRLGLYYDEAFMAQQARDFVEPQRPSTHPGSVRSVEIAGRPFPTHNAAYLGSLKSQLVIPAFAVFGASPRVLRVTTCATALIALLFAMLWLEAVFGPAAAVLTAVLVATDPAFFFMSQYEWGPFTTNLLCRSLGAWLLLVAWRRSGAVSWAAAAGAGLAFGLGIYSRADFALILAVAGLALLAFKRELVMDALRSRRVAVATGAALLLLAAAPMWTSLPALLDTSEAIADRGDLSERVALLGSTLDGTRFHRLMLAGGVFERSFDAPDADDVSVEPTALLGAALGAFVLLAFETALRRRRGEDRAGLSTRGWLLATTAGITLATLALPGAVRAHHQLNVLPLCHAVIAVTAVDLFGRTWRTPRHAFVARSALSVALGFVVAGGLVSIAQTRHLIEETGGRGRWTRALTDFASDLEANGGQAVSLDWGFHEPLQFTTRTADLQEAIWSLPAALRAGRAWMHRGDAGTVYLVHGEAYDLFGLGPRLLTFAREQGGASGVDVVVDTYRDDEGAPAFFSVRIPRPHVLVFDGRFRVQ